ncbi:DUF4249 domain-containing protein [Maribellus mangrovi]|uniref:DUF4249 domain-containing protein n=1 Tax=Maribellus mangrovi TaxID=3133146 RepID=UPI0030ED5530
MNRIPLIICLVLTLSACIEVVDLDVEDVPQELVVNCFFTENEPFVVNVSRLAQYPDLNDRNIENASVTIFENGTEKGRLKHTESGIYTSKAFTPSRGNIYSIKVEVEDYPEVTASDSIPEKVLIENCTYKRQAGYDEEGDPYGEIAIAFTDHPKVEFYTVQFYLRWLKAIYDQNGNYVGDEVIWYPTEQFSNDPVILAEGITKNDYSKYFAFNDALFTNKKYQLTVSASSEYDSEDKLRVLFETGTTHYYQYRKRLLKHESYSYEDPFRPYSPVPLYSNISGGQGIFAGYQRDIYYLHFSD